MHGLPIREVIRKREVDIACASIDLAGAEIAMSMKIGRERSLEKAFKPIAEDYDFICIDTPPSLGLLTINALTASQKVPVPSSRALTVELPSAASAVRASTSLRSEVACWSRLSTDRCWPVLVHQLLAMSLAAGGINAALGTMDPEDSWQQHAADTLRESYLLADPRIVRIVTEGAARGIGDLEREDPGQADGAGDPVKVGIFPFTRP